MYHADAARKHHYHVKMVFCNRSGTQYFAFCRVIITINSFRRLWSSQNRLTSTFVGDYRSCSCYRLSSILKAKLLKVFSIFSVNDLKTACPMSAGSGNYPNESDWKLGRCESCYKHLCCWLCLKTRIIYNLLQFQRLVTCFVM